jgi:hypothetical protein
LREIGRLRHHNALGFAADPNVDAVDHAFIEDELELHKRLV